MKAVRQHEIYGQIKYEESFWTGQKSLTVNGARLEKKDKNTFVWNVDGVDTLCTVKGGFINEATVEVGGEVISLTPKAIWYELVCSAVICMLIMVWGNSAALCKIFPLVGGAIGGGISGGMAVVNLLMMKKSENVGKKLLIWLGILAATVLACFVIAKAILSLS